MKDAPSLEIPRQQDLLASDSKGQTGLGLTALLVALSDELRKAHEVAVARGIATTAWTDASVQVQVEVELTASGGVRFWVVDVSGGAKRTASTTVTVNIRPATPDDRMGDSIVLPISGDRPGLPPR